MNITLLFLWKYLVVLCNYLCKGKYIDHAFLYFPNVTYFCGRQSKKVFCRKRVFLLNIVRKENKRNVETNIVVSTGSSKKEESLEVGEKNKERQSLYKEAKSNYLKKLLNKNDTIYGLSSGNINVHSAIGIIRISGELSINILEILLAKNVEKRKRVIMGDDNNAKSKTKAMDVGGEEREGSKCRVKEGYKKKEKYSLSDIIKMRRQWEPRRIYMGQLFDNENNFIDQVLFAVYKKPNSYTGEDVVEIFCHGNPFIIKEIMESISDLNILFTNILKKESRNLLHGINNSSDENNNNVEGATTWKVHNQYDVKKEITEKRKLCYNISRRSLLFTKIRECYKGEFTRRAFENNKMSLLEVEGLRELLFCRQKIHKQIAVSYLNGEVGKFYRKLKENVQSLLMYSQFIIDFEDEHVANAKEGKRTHEYFYKQLNNIIKSVQRIVKKKNVESIGSSQNILLLGNVNSGKSTFINFISKHDVSIVTTIKGSTIDIIQKNVCIDKNIYNFCDSAGITNAFVQFMSSSSSSSCRNQNIERSDTHKILEIMGIKKTLTYLKERSTACLVMLKVNGYIKELKNVIYIFNHCFRKRKARDIPTVFLCINKCDLLQGCSEMYDVIEQKVKKIIKKYLQRNISKKISKLFFISAKEGNNVNQLLRYINRKMIKNMNLKNRDDGDSLCFLPFERHKLSLKKALSHFVFIKKNSDVLTFDIVSEELKLALKEMNCILGKFKTEKILNQIFENFCIGK